MCYFHPYIAGEMIQFDEHIFQRGWFNHQLANNVLQILLISERCPVRCHLHFVLKIIEFSTGFIEKYSIL